MTLTYSSAPKTWWAVDRRKWRWRFPGRGQVGCKRQWWAESGAAAWLSLHTHTHQSRWRQHSKWPCTLNPTHLQTHGTRRKDTRHGKGLRKGMEGAAPGNLPGSDVNQDEMELQQEFTHLKQHSLWDIIFKRKEMSSICYTAPYIVAINV